jgi:hypothetical protein
VAGTCRDIIRDALRELDVLAPGDELTVDDAEVAIDRLQTTVLAIAEARGPWRTLDVTSDYTPGEDERVRVQAGVTIALTLPNTVSDGQGGTRAPVDGARISVVGQQRALWLYRADLNSWVQADALAIDGPAPLSSVHHGGLAAILAVALANAWPGRPAPTGLTLRRAAQANLALMTAPGVARAVQTAEHF